MSALFGTDPKQAMDEDLARLKSLLEQGKTSAEGEAFTRQGLPGNMGAASFGGCEHTNPSGVSVFVRRKGYTKMD